MREGQVNTLFTCKQKSDDPSGAGIGLKNVNARLVALYGENGGLSVQSSPGLGTTVAFTIPSA
jgi:sensor histidine kinase YesM